MAVAADLGKGFSMGDLNLLEFDALSNIETRCNITIPNATMVRTNASPAKSLLAAAIVAAIISVL
jgi:hypothetical protein